MSKIIQEQKFEKFEVVNPNNEKQYTGISEQDVLARQIESKNKSGETVKYWKVYCNNMHIATIDDAGKVVLTEEYKELLRNEKSLGQNGEKIIGERWIQSMVPVRDRFQGKDIENMQTRKGIKKINMQQRINAEIEKQSEKGIKDRKNIHVGAMSDKKNELELIEQKLGLPKDDIEACTVIKDRRFYENVVEARGIVEFSKLAYSKTKNEYIVIVGDNKDNYRVVDSIKPSKSTSGIAMEVKNEDVQEKAIFNIMELKNNDDIAYSVRLEPGSQELKLQELRIDKTAIGNDRYIASELYTTTQRPSKEEIEQLSTKNNTSISDEKRIIDDYKSAGVAVTKFQAITEEGRIKYEIITIDEVEEIISDKSDEFKDAVINELNGLQAHEITRNKLNEIIEKIKEKQKNLVQRDRGEESIAKRNRSII